MLTCTATAAQYLGSVLIRLSDSVLLRVTSKESGDGYYLFALFLRYTSLFTIQRFSNKLGCRTMMIS